jgi:hypothetical protein
MEVPLILIMATYVIPPSSCRKIDTSTQVIQKLSDYPALKLKNFTPELQN